MSLEEIEELRNDTNVVSISLCKYERTGRTLECFIDYETSQEKYQRDISETTYNSFVVKENKGERLFTTLVYKLKLFDIDSGKCIRTFKGLKENEHVNSICFSPDGKLALSGGSEGTIKIWNVALGECIRTLESHTISIRSVCFSPNGRYILSGSYDGIVKLWKTATGECINTFDVSKYCIIKVGFSKDGQSILIASQKEIRIYNIDYELFFPGWQDWDDGARPYLDIFITLHPDWTDEDFNNILIPDLQNRGFGWLRPEGVKAKLIKIYIDSLLK
jgi:WD40 repeat protein